MDNAIVVYQDHVELYLHFRYKERLQQVKWGKQFSWRTKSWNFYPNKWADTKQIAMKIREVFPDFKLFEGKIDETGGETERRIELDEEKAYIYCNAYDDNIIKSEIASASWDKEQDTLCVDLSMDNLRTLKRLFPNIILSEDKHTRDVYNGMLHGMKEYEIVTQRLNEIKESSFVRNDYEFVTKPFDHHL